MVIYYSHFMGFISGQIMPGMKIKLRPQVFSFIRYDETSARAEVVRS